eukprot:scaffold5741_cov114-Isochrysis_galbana.AAC.1
MALTAPLSFSSTPDDDELDRGTGQGLVRTSEAGDRGGGEGEQKGTYQCTRHAPPTARATKLEKELRHESKKSDPCGRRGEGASLDRRATPGGAPASLTARARCLLYCREQTGVTVPVRVQPSPSLCPDAASAPVAWIDGKQHRRRENNLLRLCDALHCRRCNRQGQNSVCD